MQLQSGEENKTQSQAPFKQKQNHKEKLPRKHSVEIKDKGFPICVTNFSPLSMLDSQRSIEQKRSPKTNRST
jgi:hypothetical protein